jgi:hypothetical protein
VKRKTSGAGYSGTPLAKKLGLSEDRALFAVDAPAHYRELLKPLPAGVVLVPKVGPTTDIVHLFVTERGALKRRLCALRSVIRADAAVWVSWPKKAAKVSTDVTEDVVREVALPLGFVDVKVCAIDETWSGLKLVIRKEDRSRTR